jgi:4-hydroxy-3-methylbut-2-enyl diphosphate reductase
VAKVHTETRRFLNRGDSVILIGHERHDETEGTMGEGPGRIALVADVEAARTVEVPDPRRVAFVTQTTLASDEVYEVAATLRQRFPGIAEPPSDDICFATTNRQNAIRAIASRSDVVLVVGSQNSSNAHRLVEVAERCGSVAHLIEDATAIRPHWLVGARSVGLSASASAPPHLVADVVATLRALGPVEVSEERVADEEVTFSLPKEVDN